MILHCVSKKKSQSWKSWYESKMAQICRVHDQPFDKICRGSGKRTDVYSGCKVVKDSVGSTLQLMNQCIYINNFR